MVFIRSLRLTSLIRIVLAMALILSARHSMAQDMDSLQALLQVTKGSRRVDVLTELSRVVLRTDNLLASTYAEEAYALATTLKDSVRICVAGRRLGIALRGLGDLERSERIFATALHIARKNRLPQVDEILNSFASLYAVAAQYDNALGLFLESLSLREASKDTSKIAIVLNNIGFVYYKLMDFDKALTNYKRSLDLKDRIGDDWDRDILLVNIALAYVYKDEFDSAAIFLKRGLNECGQDCSPYLLVQSGFAAGFIAFKQAKYNEAIRYLNKSDSIARRHGNLRLRVDNLTLLGKVYVHQGKVKHAVKCLRGAEAIVESVPKYHGERLKVYAGLNEAFNLLGNIDQVLMYQRKYILLRDSVYDANLRNNLMEVEAELAERENLTRIALQEQALDFNANLLRNQRIVNVLIAALVILIGILAVVLALLLRRKTRISDVLNQRVAERTRQLVASRNAVLSQWREHDYAMERSCGVLRSKLMTGLGLCALGQTELKDPRTARYLSELERSLTEMLNALVQRQSNDLMIMDEKVGDDGGVKGKSKRTAL